MTPSAGTVLVVDDDAAVREALDGLLRSVGFQVRLFGSVTEFLAAEPPPSPACLVLDVRLPGRSGLDLQDELAARGRPLPVVFVTGHGDIPMSVRAMKAGAVEFLTKPFREQDLLDAIQVGLERDASHAAQQAGLADLRARYAALSQREREVFIQVTAGRLNKQIAGDLGLSEVTVKVHRSQLMRKMQAASLPELVRMADRLGLRAAGP
ncbi:response regulator transcription factor [Caulobacter sp. KR2-114]|uniref:response regulator transcription factor n=1 Tax=Caulobacter sp. KR2-114 TaxID=3400912 RepID=UPI003BFE9C8D